jgi:hypothetical protein
VAGHEAREFAAVIPAGTPASAPVTITTAFPTRVVDSIHWRVPSGAHGLMGWRITMGGVQIIPFAAGTWMITDGQSGTFQLEKLPDSGAWQVMGYNTGAFPHTVYVTYMARVIQPERLPPSPWPNALLAPMPDLSRAGPPVRARP